MQQIAFKKYSEAAFNTSCKLFNDFCCMHFCFKIPCFHKCLFTIVTFHRSVDSFVSWDNAHGFN